MERRIEEGYRLWEREDALVSIAETVDAAREGAGGSLFAVGEAGLGKTALLERARDLADGFAVGFGRGEEMEQTVPFGLLFQVLDSLGVDAADVLGVSDGGAVEPSVPYVRVLRWVRNRIAGPVLIVVDDLHWADSDSLGLLAFLVRRLKDLPLAVIGTMRPWPVAAREVVRSLNADGLAAVEEIHPLSADAARAMLAERTGAEPRSATVLEACGGNPLLIEQARSIGAGEPGLSAELLRDRILLGRFAGLDEASMHCARCAALAGISFRIEVAVELAALPVNEVDDVLDALTLSGLMVEAGEGRMRFAHPLFAQALYEELAPARRRRLHHRAFELLADRGLHDEATEHAVRAGLVGDDRASQVATLAGDAALAAGAVETAVVDYEAATRFAGTEAGADLILKLATSLMAAARLDEAGEACERLIATGGHGWEVRVEALGLLGRIRYLSGAADLGEPQVAAAVELAAENSPERAVKALLDQSVSAWLHAGPVETLPLAVRARELALDLPELRRQQAEALWGQLALELGLPGGYEAAKPIGDCLLRGDRAGLLQPADLIWPGAPAYWFAHCAHYTERFDESLEAMTIARDVLEAAGSANGIAIVTGFIASHLVRRGRLGEALKEVGSVEEFADLTPLPMPFVRMVRAEALLWSGRVEESEAECRSVEALGPGTWLSRSWIDYLRGTALLWQGDTGASDHFLGVEEILNAVGMVEPGFMPWAGHAIEAHLEAGRRTDAERVLAALDVAITPGARESGPRWPASAAELAHGRIHEADGDTERAEAAYRCSAELIAPAGLPLRQAESLLVLGGFLRRHGRLVDARGPLAEATRLADEAGAGRLGAVARAELRLAGGRRRKAPEDRDRLTAAEFRVARLAAAGNTNPEIARLLHLSPHTVQSHLKRVYAKLGIDSRRKLAGIDLTGP